MGIGYFLVDPATREVANIDRAGIWFTCTSQLLKETQHKNWPFPARVLTPEVLAEVRQDLIEDEIGGGSRAWGRASLRWCSGREVVLLVDDHSACDEESCTLIHTMGWVEPEFLADD